jgi:DNA polymerase III subunit beta
MSFAMLCRPSVVQSVPAGWESVETSVPDVEFAEWKGDDSPVPPVAVDPITLAQFTADRKELLNRIKAAAKGDAVRLSINGRVDFSVLFGSRECCATKAGIDSEGKPVGETVPAHWSEPEYRLELRDFFDRSGELSAVIPFKRIQQILTKAKGDELVKVELTRHSETGESSVIVRTGNSEFTLAAETAEFPEAEAWSGPSAKLQAASLLAAIEQTAYATDVESTRYALGGVLVELSQGNLTLAATDSRRLAVITIPAECEATAHGVIPASSIEQIAKQLKATDGVVTLSIGCHDGKHPEGETADRFRVECDQWEVSGMLLQGRFPDYRMIIPTQWANVVKLNRAAFLESLETVQLVTTEESRGVDFTFASDRLTLSAKAAGVGSAKVDLPAEFGDAANIPEAITFDPRYVVDYVKRQSADVVCLALIDSGSAAMMECEGGGRYLLMPLTPDR